MERYIGLQEAGASGPVSPGSQSPAGEPGSNTKGPDGPPAQGAPLGEGSARSGHHFRSVRKVVAF
jgi:hypothetical protein